MRNIKAISNCASTGKMKTLNFISAIMCVVLFCSCTKKELAPKEYLKWYSNEENKVWSKKQVGGYDFAALYRSHEFIYLLEKDGKFEKSDFNERNKKLGNMQYYLLRIKGSDENELMAQDNAQEEDYFLKLEYFTGPMQDDISLVEGNDTLPCLLFHYERNYGISPNNNFLLGFEKGNDPIFLNTDKTLVLNDRALGTGPVSLRISAEGIKEIPALTNN